MAIKVKNYSTYVILFLIFIVVAFLYNRYKDKLDRESSNENYDSIQKYLLNDYDLGDVKKPVLWIPIEYDYNSRNWLSWGSRSSHDLNQPYIYLTVRSIIQQCSNSFHICLIDDNSFSKLLENWKYDMNKLSNPIKSYVRQLGLTSILYKYGGLIGQRKRFVDITN